MRRRDKAGGKEVRTQRRKTVKRRNAAKAVRRRNSPAAGKQTKVAQIIRERDLALEQLAATSGVLKVIRSAFELQPVLDSIVETASRLCDAEFAIIFKLENANYHVAASNNADEAFVKYASEHPIPPGRGSLTGRIALEGKTVHIPDCLADPEYTYVGYQQAGKYRSNLGVPLLREGIPIGVINLMRTVVKPFTDEEIKLVETFADQAVIAIENTRLLSELRESLQQQTATADVLKVISSSPDELEPVFNAMLENAVRICDAKFGHLWLREGDTLRVGATHGAPKAFAAYFREEPVFRPKPETGLGQLLRTKQLFQLLDIAAVPTYGDKLREATIKLAGARSLIGVPMLKDDEVIGAIVIYRQEVRPFTDKQIELVQNFATQAVIAIENVRLLSELRESLQQQTATADVLKVISSSPGELEPVFKAMLESALRICEAEFGNLMLHNSGDGSFDARVMVGAPPALVDALLHRSFTPPPGNPLDRMLRTKKTVHVVDAAAEKVKPLSAQLASARSHISVPMVKQNEVVGAISIYRTEVRPFTDKQIELVTNFAAQAVIAIENARLLKELRQRTDDLTEALEQQTATSEVLSVISRSKFDLEPILQSVVDTAARLCRAEQGGIFRVDEGIYRFAAGHSLDAGYLEFEKATPYSPGQGTVVGRAAMTRQVARIDDVLADPLYEQKNEVRNVRSAIGVPLMREGEPIGVIALARGRVEPFDDREVELVTTFADQAVIAIENVRLFESVEARTRELAASLEDLRTTQDRLVQTQKLALLGQLTAGIAHEIKNPLNFVNNFSGLSAELIDELQEALADVTLNEKKRSEITELMDTLRGNFDKVVQHGRRADAIVKNMLQHSREGSGEHRPVEVNALVEESLNLAWHGARAEKQGFEIAIKQSFDPSAGEIDVFPQDIRRALLNVISNGFHAAAKRRAEIDGGDYEPILTASTKNLGDRVEIRIRDNGTGIAPEVKDKMFNPFFTTKPTGEGTGLGLSISHDIIVKQHAGSIEVDTQLGEFTEIRIVLPRVAALLPERL